MTDIDRQAPMESASGIRIVGLNTDKTARMTGSEKDYEVYFELSDTPSLAWRTLFAHEWKTLGAGQVVSLQEPGIDRGFLIIRSPLPDVANHLPVLKKAVAATNSAYRLYSEKQVTEQKERENVWKDERKTVEELEKLLHFE